MPRGRPKKPAAQVELLLPDETDQPQARQIKHKTEWIETVPVEETETETEVFDDDDTEDKPKKKKQSYREELRKKLRAGGVSPATRLTITIEKYANSESGERGTWADREFCTKQFCEETYVLDEGYMDLLKQWGPGTYRITLRLNGSVVDAFDKRVAAPPRNNQIIQNVNPNDPNSPQVIYQPVGDGQQQQPMSMKDIMKAQKEALKEHLEMTKLMREAYGFTPEAPATPKSEDEMLASAILKNPDVVENVLGNVMKRFGSKGGSGEDEPWYAEIVRDAVKSGQAAQIVQVAIDRVFNGFQSFIPQRGNQNGQAQMVQTQVSQTDHSPNSQSTISPHHNLPAQTESQGLQGLAQTEPDNISRNQPPTPEDQALGLLIDHCRRQIPPKIAASRLFALADAVNEQAPALSIDGYIEMLGTSPTDAVIEFVKTLPNGDQIAALPHAAEWTAELQRLIKESQEGEGE